MENLKMEHQEQIAFMETNIAQKMQKEIQKIQATSDQQMAQYVESIHCSNKKFKHYNNLTQTHPTCQTTINQLTMRLS